MSRGYTLAPQSGGYFNGRYASYWNTFFDLCRSILKHANVKCELHHFDENANQHVTCEQGFSPIDWMEEILRPDSKPSNAPVSDRVRKGQR